jgi:hypothetical protein
VLAYPYDGRGFVEPKMLQYCILTLSSKEFIYNEVLTSLQYKIHNYFQIVFEGEVGRNSLGNIAIDDISVAPGVCPTAPQVCTLFKKIKM